jgi:hypothetical protein
MYSETSEWPFTCCPCAASPLCGALRVPSLFNFCRALATERVLVEKSLMEGEKKHEGTGVRSLMEGNKAMLLLAHRQLDGRCQVLGGETQVDIRDLLVVDLCSAGLNQFTAVGLARCEPQLHVQLHSPAPMPVRPPITYAHTQAGVRHKDKTLRGGRNGRVCGLWQGGHAR